MYFVADLLAYLISVVLSPRPATCLVPSICPFQPPSVLAQVRVQMHSEGHQALLKCIYITKVGGYEIWMHILVGPHGIQFVLLSFSLCLFFPISFLSTELVSL